VLFGLHNNAEIGFLLSSSDTLINTVIDLQGEGAAAAETGGALGGGDSAMITELHGRLPAEFNMILLDQSVQD
jgi:hypothetical protein